MGEKGWKGVEGMLRYNGYLGCKWGERGLGVGVFGGGWGHNGMSWAQRGVLE